jgi:hypothetical protein
LSCVDCALKLESESRMARKVRSDLFIFLSPNDRQTEY